MTKNTQIANNAAPVIDLDALDATLAGLDLTASADTDEVVLEDDPEAFENIDASADDSVVEETAETEMSTDNSVIDDDVLVDLELDAERKEAYAAQDGGPALESVAKVEPTAKPARRAKTPSGTATAKSSGRIPRDLNTVAAEFFVLNADPAALSDEEKDKAKIDTLALRDGISQVKVVEKFENLITALSVGKAPSTYTKIAFDLLDAKKTVTSADIIGAYKASGLKEGTARSQTGQMMTLFGAVGIATRTGQKLELRADSRLAQRMRDLPKAA
ncbi:MAG: hypothetical protein DI537_14475 [Stutzerimonas stutzeri]|nr:MAG: hypothetical protein DI537_14475 [Stutzerimonas stutzeri]